MNFDSQRIKALVEKENIQLSHLRRSLPAEVFRISPWKSWLTCLRILSILTLCLWLETKTNNPALLIPLWILHGQVLVGLFVLAHDCGHGSFSQKSWSNTIVGHLSFAPLGNGLVTWQLTHNHHHAHTQKKGQEVDWSKWLVTKEQYEKTTWKKNFVTRLGYSLPFGILAWVGWNAIRRGFRKDKILDKALTAKQEKAVTRSNLFMLTILAIIYGVLYSHGGLWAAFKYHGLPATIAMVTGYILLIIQHANESSLWFEETEWSPAKGQLSATYDERFPRFLEWLWLDINIHIPHHVAPNIPWYHLRAARKSLLNLYPDYYQERKFRLENVKWMLRTPFIARSSAASEYHLAK